MWQSAGWYVCTAERGRKSRMSDSNFWVDHIHLNITFSIKHLFDGRVCCWNDRSADLATSMNVISSLTTGLTTTAVSFIRDCRQHWVYLSP